MVKKKIGELVEYKKGKPVKKTINPKNIELYYLTPEYLRGKEIPELFEVQPNSVVVNDGDLILLWDGSNAGEFFKAKKGILSSTMVVFEFKYSLNKSYAFYAFKYFEPYLKGQTSGSGIPHVDKEILLNHKIDLFGDFEQCKIANILNKIDKAIKQTKEITFKQERIKEGLLQDLFSNGIDDNGNIRNQETHEFNPSPFGMIPSEWDINLINNVTTFVGSGITPRGGSEVYVKEGVHFIRSQNVHNDGIRSKDLVYITHIIDKMMKRTRVQNRDILLNITGASIGRCCSVPIGFPKANVNQHVCIIRLKNHTPQDAHYYSQFITSYLGQKQIMALNAGSNREGLNYQQVRNIIVPVPEEEERVKIAEILERASKNIAKSKAQLSKLKNIKAGLMQDLLTGKVRVNHLIEKEACQNA